MKFYYSFFTAALVVASALATDPSPLSGAAGGGGTTKNDSSHHLRREISHLPLSSLVGSDDLDEQHADAYNNNDEIADDLERATHNHEMAAMEYEKALAIAEEHDLLEEGGGIQNEEYDESAAAAAYEYYMMAAFEYEAAARDYETAAAAAGGGFGDDNNGGFTVQTNGGAMWAAPCQELNNCWYNGELGRDDGWCGYPEKWTTTVQFSLQLCCYWDDRYRVVRAFHPDSGTEAQRCVRRDGY